MMMMMKHVGHSNKDKRRSI